MKKKNMIAPIVVAIVVVLYYVLFFALLMSQIEGLLKYVLGIVPLLLSAVMITVCTQRIQEIRKGEEDDLGQY